MPLGADRIRIFGAAPAWFATDRYDIDGVADAVLQLCEAGARAALGVVEH